MDSLSTLLTVTTAGVTLHNVLQALAARLGRVAADVGTGNAQVLRNDVVSVADAVQAHDPALIATVTADAQRIAAAAEAEVLRVRHNAAEELRRLAAVVEQAAGATAPASPAVMSDPAAAPVAVVLAPQAVDPTPASAV
ncbi:hypothetical protein P3T36_006908 [Kitasatospora sp. MAP12-15]|uniref:hypothetical protein n=1 Tax=unclassified Kitasatospora TaxID=2633591 RepID=UPI002474BA66|nr:hypothetical protein [Kitasatospora sp. MAP12-44]MDH6111909.1 hypothetical protein [Kitasatospora sp. MAP12-44]